MCVCHRDGLQTPLLIFKVRKVLVVVGGGDVLLGLQGEGAHTRVCLKKKNKTHCMHTLASPHAHSRHLFDCQHSILSITRAFNHSSRC